MLVILPFIISTKHPNTTDNKPDEQEDEQNTLETTRTPVEAALHRRRLLVAFFLLCAEQSLEDVDDGVEETHTPKDNQEDGNVLLKLTIIEVNGTC